MEAAQSTFISSTFWTERIGPTAALKTLQVMERDHSWATVTATGLDLRSRWQDLADRYGLKINLRFTCLDKFHVQSPKAYKH